MFAFNQNSKHNQDFYMKSLRSFIVICALFFISGFYLARFREEVASTILTLSKQKTPVLDFGFKPSLYPLKNNPFVIIIVGRNNGAFLEKTLNSALSQKYDAFRIIYIDDGSSDGSSKLARNLIYASDSTCHVQFVENPFSLGTNVNLTKAISSCADEEIILLLNGEDFLAHEWALEKINQYFMNPDLWMAFCGAMEFPSFSKIPPPAPSKKAFEKETLQHTSFSNFYIPCFYAKLFKQINPSDITNKEHHFPENYPLTYMIPLLEMAEHHFHYIQETLYLTTIPQPTPSKIQDYTQNTSPYPSVAHLFRETPLNNHH